MIKKQLTSQKNPKVKLPKVSKKSESMLCAITEALEVDREVLPSDDQINHVWKNLPRQLKKIPPELRDLGMLRLCVAASVGLFDSSINYVWNSTIIELRRKVREFGIAVVAQITGDSFTESKLTEQKDYELLKLCLQLNLISEEAYFKLDQCRAIRNNFSAAHPAMGDVDEDEVINFISRCARYALSDKEVPSGVKIADLISATKGNKLTDDQEGYWKQKINATHVAQKSFIITTLHGIYCDENVSQSARLNCLSLVQSCYEDDSQYVDAIENHQNYKGKGEDKKAAASRDFFTKIGRLNLLDDSEVHEIFAKACTRLISVHQAFDNFYNEGPFAERLLEISQQSGVPGTVRNKFVEAVVMCSVGNQYGTAKVADLSYRKIIEDFSPAEIATLLDLQKSKTLTGSRINSYERCSKKYLEIVGWLDADSIPTKYVGQYEKLLG